MICRDKIIFSCLIACGLGAAGGYLFSSKFCKVTIIKRVAKEIALNQTMRQLFTENSFWGHNYIRSIFFNSPDQAAIAQRLLKNQEKLVNIIKAYYGAAASDQLRQLVSRNFTLLSQIVTAKKENQSITDLADSLNKNSNAIATLLSELNPAWLDNKARIAPDKQLAYITSEVEALQKNNWSREIELFDAHLEQALQRADEVDRGITTQFPEKF